MDTTQKAPPALAQLAATYRDEEEARAFRNEALAELIAAYAGPDELARQEEAGNLLAECLGPLIRQVAWEVARGGSPSERKDFVDEALSLVVAPREGKPARICACRPDPSPQAWLRTVLRNLWVSNRRQRASRQQALEQFAGRRPPSVVSWDRLCLAEPLSNRDLDRIAGWEPRSRVEVLCLAGLWPYAPAPRWECWLAEYESLRHLSLGRPFPAEDVLHCDERADRLRPLAQALHYSPNALSVRWLRAKDCLKELDFVRELKPT
jgi:DNA-directed RNA polymerase specialized sigma24 family protein